MHDSGKREKFESGAIRDTAEGKSRPDLVSPYAEERIGNWMAKGAEKYSERNWEKGISISRCVASMQRHLVAFKMGLQDEDHLAAIAVNAQFIMHYQAMIGRGKLPATLEDMPDYEDIIRRGELKELLAEDVKPKFKAGDKVSIKLHGNTGDYTRTSVEAANNMGIYVKPKGEGHCVTFSDIERWFYDDEVFPVEDN